MLKVCRQKSLLESAEVLDIEKEKRMIMGLRLIQEVYQLIGIKYRREITNRNATRPRIQYLMKKNKIKVVKGKAKFETDHRMRVVQGNKEEVVDGESFIIAAGSEPTELPFAPFDENGF